MSARRDLPESAAQTLLLDRARKVASPRGLETPHEPLALFLRGGQLFGLSLPFLRFTWSARGLIEVPGAPRYIVGAIPGDGALVTVLDLVHLYDLPMGGVADLKTVLVAELGGRRIGIACERVLGAQAVTVDSFKTAPRAYGAVQRTALWRMETVQVLELILLFKDARLNPSRAVSAR